APAARASGTATVFLAETLGGRILTCNVQGWDPSVIQVKASVLRVSARAREMSRGALWTVSAANMRGGLDVAIILSNNIDGPLATAVLVIPTVQLRQMAKYVGPSAMGVRASVFYREGYNGTNARFAAVCHF